MINILIADNYTLTRKDAKQLIQANADMIVVGEARNGLEALKMARRETWDVLLLDLLMPIWTGIEILQKLRCRTRHLPILIMGAYPVEELYLGLMKAGAAGYISKVAGLVDLVPAIRQVAHGGTYLSPVLGDLVTPYDRV